MQKGNSVIIYHQTTLLVLSVYSSGSAVVTKQTTALKLTNYDVFINEHHGTHAS